MNKKRRAFPVYRVPVNELLARDAFGAGAGAEVRRKIDASLGPRPERIIELDLQGVKVIDASCAREALASLVRNHAGRKVFFASGDLSEDVRENIDLAFTKLDLSLLHRTARTGYQIIGAQLKPHLATTLEVVERLSVTTAKDIAQQVDGGITVPACNNRLRDLTEAGLVLRLETNAESGGKEFTYVSVRA